MKLVKLSNLCLKHWLELKDITNFVSFKIRMKIPTGWYYNDSCSQAFHHDDNKKSCSSARGMVSGFWTGFWNVFQIHSPVLPNFHSHCIKHIRQCVYLLVSAHKSVQEFVQNLLQPLVLLALQNPVAAAAKVHQLLCKKVFYSSVLKCCLTSFNKYP